MSEINTSEGYICLFRKFTNWEWYDDANTMRVFLHCLLSANHKDNKWRGILIQKGSFITSVSKLSHSLKLTPQQIRTCINKLKSTNEITCKTTSSFTLITVNKWNLYQQNNKQDNKSITNEQQTDNKRVTTNNNDNNDNNENNENNFLAEKPKTKTIDPYCNKYQQEFIKTYKDIFGCKCFLNTIDLNKLTELATIHDDFIELIPIALRKLKEINFKDIGYKPTATWLLKDNNFERVLNNEFTPNDSQDDNLEKKGMIQLSSGRYITKEEYDIMSEGMR